MYVRKRCARNVTRDGTGIYGAYAQYSVRVINYRSAVHAPTARERINDVHQSEMDLADTSHISW